MRNKKKLAANILKVSPKKVKFITSALEEIKKAITRSDIRGLIAIKKIVKTNAKEHSKARSRKIKLQKKKGRRKGRGSKKGPKYSTIGRKERWMLKIRTQRSFIKELKGKNLISSKNYQDLYSKTKGGFFRNKRHIKLYLNENKFIKNKD